MLNSDFPDGQFIFKESEFEEETFAAAAFVAKYRRVSSLESIKEQLQQYSNGLKQQLYNIINRDYKDFITISTKLDGVDTRTSLLQKPLVDVRSDLSSLHEGILTGMQAIQEKVKHRVEVANRRKLVETFLQCLSHLEATESVLNASVGLGTQDGEGSVSGGTSSVSGGGDSVGRASQRTRLLRAMDRRIALAGNKHNTTNNTTNTTTISTTNTTTTTTTSTTNTSTSVLLLEKDVFVCSELERASSCLAAVDSSLHSLLQHINNTTVSAEDSQPDDKQPLQSRSAVLSMYKALDMQARTYREMLVKKIHSHLTHLLTNSLGGVSTSDTSSGSTTSVGSSVGNNSGSSTSVGTSSSGNRSPAGLRSRSFAHCLRALCTLRKGEVAEGLVRDTVVGPYLRSFLTVGRVDGKGGRGTYSGLEDALQTVLDTLTTSTSSGGGVGGSVGGGGGNSSVVVSSGVSGSSGATTTTPSFLLTCLSVAEGVLAYAPSTDTTTDTTTSTNTTSTTSTNTTTTITNNTNTTTNNTNKHTVDLILHSIWQPLTELLTDRFADMYSIGIPNTLSHCYRCITRFLHKLTLLCGVQYAQCISNRVYTHTLVTTFFAHWKLDLYYQLRCKEVFSRVDRVCEASLRAGVTGSVGSSVGGGGSVGSGGGSNSSVGSVGVSVTNSLTTTDYTTITTEINTQLALHTPLFTSFATELRTCLHPTVLLPPLVPKFLTLILRTLMRLEAHIAVWCSVTTPSFSKSDVEQLKLVYTNNNSTNNTSSTNNTTPAKKLTTTNTPNTTGNTNNTTTNTTTTTPPLVLGVLSQDELLLVAGDLLSLEQWLLAHYSTTAAAALAIHTYTASTTTGTGIVNNTNNTTTTNTSTNNTSINLQHVDIIRHTLTQQVHKLHTSRVEIFVKISTLLSVECRKALGAVKTAVVSKYRMTNKPAPESASVYVETILLPLRKFLSEHVVLVSKLCDEGSSSGNSGVGGGTSVGGISGGSSSGSGGGSSVGTSVSGTIVGGSSSTSEGLRKWKVALAGEISVAYTEQVSALIDTVRQMDSTLQRRSRLQTNTTSSMSDSEKIALQIRLDVVAFGKELSTLHIDTADVPAYKVLYDLSVVDTSS